MSATTTTTTTVVETEKPVAKEHKVFVGNLSFKTTKESLTSFAETSGKVLETTIITRHKKSAGYGFITFETEKDAEKAAKELNHQSLEGREINVEVARPPKISVSTSSTGSSSNAATGEESAKKTRKTKSKRNNKKSNTSAVATEKDQEAAAEVKKDEEAKQEEKATTTDVKEGGKKKKNNNKKFKATKTKAVEKEGEENKEQEEKKEEETTADSSVEEAARRKRANQKTKKRQNRKLAAESKRAAALANSEPSKTTLFVANLPYATTTEDLEKIFASYNFVSAHVARMKHGKSKGYGFVEFANEQDQLKTLESVKDVVLEGRSIYLKVALSEQKKQEESEVKEGDKEVEKEMTVESLKVDDTKK